MAYWYGIALFIMVFLTAKRLNLDVFSFSKESRATLFLRGTIGMAGNIFYNISLTFISMSKASVLFWTNPIVIAFLGKFFLGEKLTYYDWAACFLAFLGIIMIQNPFQSSLTDNEDSHRDFMGTAFALIGSLFAGVVGFSVRKLANKTHYLFPTLSFAFFNILIAPIMTVSKLFLIENTLVVYTWYEVLMLLLIAVEMYLVLILQTWAYKYEKAGRLAPILYIQIIVNCLLDIILYKTELKVN